MAVPGHLLVPLTLLLSAPWAGLAACGSGAVGSLPEEEHVGGGPAAAVPTREAGTAADDGGTREGAVAPSSVSSSDAATGTIQPQTSARFTLIDTSSTATSPAGSPIQGFDPMGEGATIDLGTLGAQLSILVQPPPNTTVGSLALALDATYTHTAESSPYALCGMKGEDAYNPCAFTIGKHTLTVTTYSEPDLQGAPYQPPTMFQFTVVDSTADAGDGGD